MELDELRIFRAVVDEGGVTAAARSLHRVQSNVTTRVRQMERALGVELFRREGRALQLTPAGRRLYEYADRLLTLAAEARAAVVKEPVADRLRLGAMESVAATRLPAILAGFQRRHPQVQVELATATWRRLVTGLQEGQHDLVLVGEAADERLFVDTPLWQEELMLVADAAQAGARTAREVRGRALLTFASGCAYRARLEQWLTAMRIVPPRVLEFSSYHGILAGAAGGGGVAAVPRSVLERYSERRSLSVHSLPARYARLTVRLLAPRERPHAAAELFARYLGEHCGGKGREAAA